MQCNKTLRHSVTDNHTDSVLTHDLLSASVLSIKVATKFQPSTKIKQSAVSPLHSTLLLRFFKAFDLLMLAPLIQSIR